MLSVNRSKTYLLPLLGEHIELTNLVISNIYNTYLYCENEPKSERAFYIVISEKTVSEVAIDVIHEHLTSSDIYSKCIRDNGKRIYKFLFPDDINKDYDLLIDGKFSQISDDAKQFIILFLNKNFASEFKTLITVKSILSKSKELRSAIEEDLDVEIDDDMELGSRFNLSEEKYKLTNKIKIKEDG